jgi:hypothetical protein
MDRHKVEYRKMLFSVCYLDEHSIRNHKVLLCSILKTDLRHAKQYFRV